MPYLGANIMLSHKIPKYLMCKYFTWLVQIKLMDTLLCQDYDYLMSDCSSGWVYPRKEYFSFSTSAKWISTSALCSDILEVLFYDFFN